MTAEIYREITDRIVAALRAGVRPWHRPWRVTGMPMRYAGLPYRGMNALILSLAADQEGYESAYWLSAAQGRKCRAKIREGETCTRVLRPIMVPRHADPGKDSGDANVPLMRSYEVFNAEQFDRLPPRFRPRVDPQHRIGAQDRVDAAERFFGAIGATIEHKGSRACYRRLDDVIQMPGFEHFEDPASYYAVLCHEAIHWTGDPGRLNRTKGKRFGDEAYAMEEMVAELGAAFLMNGFSLPLRVRESSAPYVDSWIRVLDRDVQAIYSAASHAQRAADYVTILSVSGRVNELAARRLDDRTYIIVYLDIVDIGSHPVVVAVGVDSTGNKRVLGMRLGGNRARKGASASRSLLLDLVRRGLERNRRRLFVTDGSPLLKRDILEVFGWESFIQACRAHRVRDVLGHLPKDERGAAKKVFDDAWRHGAAEGRRSLEGLVEHLEAGGRAAAAASLRPNLNDLFTVDSFEIDPRLVRSLATTHVIDGARSGLSRQVCGISNWRDPTVALRWAAASFLEAEKGYNRIAGSGRIQLLKDHLDQIELPLAASVHPTSTGEPSP